MAIKITDLRIDPKSLGDTFLLADIQAVYQYIDGKRDNNKLIGYKYYCVLPALKMEKLGVKIEHKIPLIDIDKGQEIPIGMQVHFENLEVGTYYMNNQINISAKASSIRFAGNDNVQLQKEIKQ